MEDELFPIDPPTGNTVVWKCDIRLAPTVAMLLEELEIAQMRNDADGYGIARDQLTSLPGHPATQPGDGIMIEWQMPSVVVPVPREGYGDPRGIIVAKE